MYESAKLISQAQTFLDAFDRGDLDSVMALFEEGGIYEDAYGQRFEGSTAVREGLTVLFDGTFGKPRYAVEELFCDEDQGKVLARWRCDAEMGGNAVVLNGLDVLHFEPGGKVRAKLAFLKAKEPLVSVD